MKNQFSAIVKAVLDLTGIEKKDIDEIQKITNKHPVKIKTEIDKTSAEEAGKRGLSWIDRLNDAWTKFNNNALLIDAFKTAVSGAKQVLTELKSMDTLLTRISKANNSLSKSQLENIANNSFDIASKYGKKATDYLSSIQDMSKSGYKSTEHITELSMAAQSAGDMTAEVANKYIIATDKAYQMNGSIKALTETLDGANYITNNNAVNMTELAEGMSIVSSQAASSGIAVDETTAALATMIATTKQSGPEMANAFNGILMNLRQVTGEGIDAEALIQYEAACKDLGVSLSEVKDGVVSLKSPMQILKELSEEYTKLDKTDVKRSNLISAVGGGNQGDALNAILENYGMYEKMLKEYADGTGSITREAEKTANSLEGALNRVSNTWTDTVGNMANSDAIITLINGFNSLLSVINKISEFSPAGALGALSGLAFNKIGLGKLTAPLFIRLHNNAMQLT